MTAINGPLPFDLAIGNDLEDVVSFNERVNPGMLRMCFSAREMEHIRAGDRQKERMASSWAGKEAAYKALRQLYPGISLPFNLIEIIRSEGLGNAPRVCLPLEYCHVNISLSLTEKKGLCNAVCAMWVYRNDG